VVGTGDHVRLNRLTAEVEVEPRRDLSLRAGVRYAWQDVNLSSGDGPQSTGTLGAIADVRYRPCAPVDLFLRYENAQIDDPYTIAGDPSARPPLPGRETTLTVRNRGSAGLTVRPWTWATLSYRLVADSGTNGSFDARSQAFGNSATVTLTPLANLTFFGSYTRRDLDNRADIDFAPSYARATSVQSGSEDVLVSQLTYDFGLAGERWQSGWNVYYVQSDQQLRPRFAGDLVGRTAFDLDRVDAGAFLTWVHPWVEPTVEVRRIDYNEPGHPRNDYQATIIVVKLTRRFGTSAIH
jgi:hypothetical protein